VLLMTDIPNVVIIILYMEQGCHFKWGK